MGDGTKANLTGEHGTPEIRPALHVFVAAASVEARCVEDSLRRLAPNAEIVCHGALSEAITLSGDTRVLVPVPAPTRSLGAVLKVEKSIPVALKTWSASAEALLTQVGRARDKVFLVALGDLEAPTAAFRAILADAFGGLIDTSDEGLGAVTDAEETTTDAAYLLSVDSVAKRLAAQIDALLVSGVAADETASASEGDNIDLALARAEALQRLLDEAQRTRSDREETLGQLILNMRQEAEALRTTMHVLQLENQRILGSWSWRLTRPLRAVWLKLRR